MKYVLLCLMVISQCISAQETQCTDQEDSQCCIEQNTDNAQPETPIIRQGAQVVPEWATSKEEDIINFDDYDLPAPEFKEPSRLVELVRIFGIKILFKYYEVKDWVVGKIYCTNIK